MQQVDGAASFLGNEDKLLDEQTFARALQPGHKNHALGLGKLAEVVVEGGGDGND